MNRRRILLSYLANSFSWELYSKTYFYNELVPTTINSKNVLNKAKIVKISGNGVIENQLVQNGNFEDDSVWSVNEGGSVTIANNVATYTQVGSSRLRQIVNTIPNHKYLLTLVAKSNSNCNISMEIRRGWISSSKPLVANVKTKIYDFLTPTTTGDFPSEWFQIFTSVANSITEISEVMVIDLTLMFGTGNEPTTLTDNRIQNILNRGYIAYNLGKYKESDIGVVSSYSYPPQLLGAKSLLTYSGSREIATSGNYVALYKNFGGGGTGLEFSQFTNEQLTHKFFAYAEIEYNASNTLTNMHFAAQGTVASTYVIESHSKICSIIQPTNVSVSMYLYGTLQPSITLGNHFLIDLTELGIDTLTAQQVYNLLNDTIISKLANGDTLNDALDTITFKAQLGGAINSHNTMEITNSAYVFTRNVWKVDLGTLTWNYSSTYNRFDFYNYTNAFPHFKTTPSSSIGNAVCRLYTTQSRDTIRDNINLNNVISIHTSDTDYINIRNTSYTNAATFQSAMAGVYLYYELATPQVISIPRKHLGIYTFTGNEDYIDWSGGGKSLTIELPNAKKPSSNTDVANVYWTLGLTYQSFAIGDREEYSIGIAPNGRLYISTTKTKAQLQSALIGYSVFYETENEVADIENVVDIESGGTITTDSEVLPNIELSIKGK